MAEKKDESPTKKTRKKMGRPTKYTDEITYEICDLLAGGVSLKKISDMPHMPTRATMYKWMDEHGDFLNRYTRAKQDCADYMVDEMLEIADDGTNDYNERFDKNGEVMGWQVNHEHVNRSRLRVDARKWIAAKLKPLKYGEKISSEISGPEGKPVEVKSIGIVGVSPNASDKDS
jgi:hypothetical protein